MVSLEGDAEDTDGRRGQRKGEVSRSYLLEFSEEKENVPGKVIRLWIGSFGPSELTWATRDQ